MSTMNLLYLIVGFFVGFLVTTELYDWADKK